MKIALLGSGNVATHLGKALNEAGHEVIQVWSRTLQNAKALAGELEAGFTDNISEITDQADIYIVSVKDDWIEQVVSKFPFKDKILIHTSGTTELDIPGISGVIYPLQTFSKQRKVDFSIIPIVVEGRDELTIKLVYELAQSLSSNVVKLNSTQRKALHVAAVFACNFTNHLYSIAGDILKNEALDFGLLKPLIAETAGKIQQNEPASVQTGPAHRKDQSTLNKHLQFLENNATFKELYERLSQSIINFNEKA